MDGWLPSLVQAVGALLVGIVLAIGGGAWRKYGQRMERLYELAAKMTPGSGPQQEFLRAADAEAARLAHRVTRQAWETLALRVFRTASVLGDVMVLGGLFNGYLMLHLVQALEGQIRDYARSYAVGYRLADPGGRPSIVGAIVSLALGAILNLAWFGSGLALLIYRRKALQARARAFFAAHKIIVAAGTLALLTYDAFVVIT